MKTQLIRITSITVILKHLHNAKDVHGIAASAALNCGTNWAIMNAVQNTVESIGGVSREPWCDGPMAGSGLRT